MSTRIAVSLRGQMRALASQGIFATDCYEQLKSILLQKFGPDHAALLAEPQHNAEGNSVDWYAEGNGPAVPLGDLAEPEAQALRARAGALAADIAGLANDLTVDAQARQAISGQLLRLALQHPTDEDIWSVDGKPVLINWGFAPGSVGAQPQDLTRLGGVLPPPPPAAPVPAAVPVAVPPRGGCLPWLLPLLLLLLLLWLLGAALGLLPSPLPAGCMPVDRAALEAEKQKAAANEDQLALLWRQLQEKAALCKPVTPPVTPPAAPKVEPKVEEPKQPDPEVVEPFLGETPVEPPKVAEAPKPKPQPKPKPEPVQPPKEEPKQQEPPKPAPKKNDNLAIPEDAAKKNDLSFLEGCWTSETGLYSHPSNEPIIAEYCFDKSGRGRRLVRERNGQVCSGSASARFQGNQLQFDSSQARCPRGGTYVPQKVECNGQENTTQCKGRELGGANLKWDARFKRK